MMITPTDGHQPNLSVTASINKDLLDWSGLALAPWQHEALRRILSKGMLSEQDRAAIFERAQLDHGYTKSATGLPSLQLTDADLPVGNAEQEQLWLTGIKHLEHVNALKPDQRLVVGKQLTLVYGENGSGKSGYARILKKTARCTDKAIEPILPDVFSAAAEPPPAKAVFEVDRGCGPEDVFWQDGNPAPTELKRFAVFDSKCARHVLNDSNQLSFAPSIFEALTNLGTATDFVRQQFLAEVTRSTPANLPLPQLIHDQTAVGAALRGLSVQIDPESIKLLGRWGEEENVILAAKEMELATLRSQSPQTLRDQIGRERRDAEVLRAKIAEVSSALSADVVQTLRQQMKELDTHERAYQAAVKLALGESTIEGVGSDSWKSLIEAAAKFSTTEAYRADPFPASAEGALCVLCQQPLGSEATERLRGFWVFLQGDAALKLDAAKEVVALSAAKLAPLPRSTPPAIMVLREEYERNHEVLWQKTVEFFESANARVAAIERALTDESWNDVPDLSLEAEVVCKGLVDALDDRLKVIQDDQNAEATISVLISETAELKARKQLSENLQSVLDYIEALRRAARARKAADEIKTNTISLKAKELHSSFVTEAFRARVRGKLTSIGLRRARVAIGEKSEKGKVLHSFAVDGAKISVPPESIFSEGEQTAMSLAFFLADLGPPTDTCGVIFDDPVTSLDHRIREGVVNTLVSEAKARQVIVFTHDLAFYFELISAAEQGQVDVVSNHVESFNTTVGYLSTSAPRESQKVTQRYGELERLIKDAEEADSPAVFRGAVDRFYSLLRAAWERSVEELLFNQVVSRFQKEVATRKLDGVVVDLEGITAVSRGMTRGSSRTDAHDHAVATALPTPTPADLKEHLKELKDFVAAQTAKRKDAEKANKHLK